MLSWALQVFVVGVLGSSSMLQYCQLVTALTALHACDNIKAAST